MPAHPGKLHELVPKRTPAGRREASRAADSCSSRRRAAAGEAGGSGGSKRPGCQGVGFVTEWIISRRIPTRRVVGSCQRGERENNEATTCLSIAPFLPALSQEPHHGSRCVPKTARFEGV